MIRHDMSGRVRAIVRTPFIFHVN